ncbi:hypothetical protein VNO78_12526 [Psophocarpus tetragonolobus]|uniref:Uncharacterized protein n=1 Tax=Psophocarpus tetragonolobus TaxID=3891 RepID=A0AAN9SN61_PSOTE
MSASEGNRAPIAIVESYRWHGSSWDICHLVYYLKLPQVSFPCRATFPPLPITRNCNLAQSNPRMPCVSEVYALFCHVPVVLVVPVMCTLLRSMHSRSMIWVPRCLFARIPLGDTALRKSIATRVMSTCRIVTAQVLLAATILPLLPSLSRSGALACSVMIGPTTSRY